MFVLAAVSDPRLRGLLSAATASLGVVVRWTPPRGCPEPDGVAGAALLVHDLQPDPPRQVAWLQQVTAGVHGVGIVLLLPLREDVLSAAVLHAARLPVVGAVIGTGDLTAAKLAEALRSVVGEDLRAWALWSRVEGWALAPPLRRLAFAALVRAPQRARPAEVLRLAGASYEVLRRAAARAGVPPPRGFVETLRLLRAVLSLQLNVAVGCVAERYGFADADHLRERLRRQFGVTPTAARELGAAALLERLEARWIAPCDGAARRRRRPPAEPAPALADGVRAAEAALEDGRGWARLEELREAVARR